MEPDRSNCVDLLQPERDQRMSDMTVGAVLKRMGPADLAPHGFRASFRDRAAELTDAPNHVALNMRGALDWKQSLSRVTARRFREWQIRPPTVKARRCGRGNLHGEPQAAL